MPKRQLAAPQAPSDHARGARMSEVQRLKDRIEELEGLLGMGEDDATLILAATGLSLTACKMVGVIRKRASVTTKDMLYTMLYGDRSEGDQPDPKIIHVEICKARAGLRSFGIEIQTVWGIGFRMDPGSRRKLAALMASKLEIAA
ncbi:MAG: hypothetical protein NVS3B5_02120 [Sphingomicrobium sp.]